MRKQYGFTGIMWKDPDQMKRLDELADRINARRGSAIRFAVDYTHAHFNPFHPAVPAAVKGEDHVG